MYYSLCRCDKGYVIINNVDKDFVLDKQVLTGNVGVYPITALAQRTSLSLFMSTLQIAQRILSKFDDEAKRVYIEILDAIRDTIITDTKEPITCQYAVAKIIVDFIRIYDVDDIIYEFLQGLYEENITTFGVFNDFDSPHTHTNIEIASMAVVSMLFVQVQGIYTTVHAFHSSVITMLAVFEDLYPVGLDMLSDAIEPLNSLVSLFSNTKTHSNMAMTVVVDTFLPLFEFNRLGHNVLDQLRNKIYKVCSPL